MRYVTLGSTGLRVSRLVFGGAQLGQSIHEAEANAYFGAALDVGINTFYTADDFSAGDAETRLWAEPCQNIVTP